ncbi:MAG TPA: hypothetical protein VGN16_12160 [Acidobacteriaceae bacterium]|jgi:hypothetical protein
MRLTSPSGPPRRRSSSSSSKRALTTEPGFTNPNRQKVIASTGASSSARDGQAIYRLRCGACSHEYGCNGLDIKGRLCPACQGGVEGEALRELAPMFDFGE